MATPLDQFQLLVRAGHPILGIVTLEEDRAAKLIRTAADKLGYPLYEWSITTGMERILPDIATTGVKRGKPTDALDWVMENKEERSIYVLKDFGPHCREPLVLRQLRDVNNQSVAHVVLLESSPLPETIGRLTVSVALPLPDTTELEQIIKETCRKVVKASFSDTKVSLTRKDIEQLVQTLRGLTAVEASRVISTAIHNDDELSGRDLPEVIEAKRNILRGAGCLESVTANVSVSDIGGLDNLKQWLARRRGGLTSHGRSFGLDPPRGMLLLGVQGCGKSLCAKVVAADWNMPLLRLDPGMLYQKFVGESENRLRDALAQAESMAPAVLWVDEIEKAFASAAAESADGGLSQRMFGTLLTWMQDHDSPIFLVATANNVAALPPELMRKGRFDEVFFVDLPTAAVRKLILAIHLRRRKREPRLFQLEAIAEATEGFSGAELEQVVIAALYDAFTAETELATEHLITEAQRTKPLSVLMAEKVRQLRAWALDRCVPAD